MADDDRVSVSGEELTPKDDRPRGFLSVDDREFLRGKKEFKHVESNANARARIRERTVNALLDFVLVENYIEDRDRKRIFDSFDANKIYDDDTELYAPERSHVGVLSDLIALIYRETQDRHPPFDMILEHGIMQGENDPGTVHYGEYNVELSVEELSPPENIDIDAVVERVKSGNVETLTDAEMSVFIQLFAASERFDSESVRQDFMTRLKEYQDTHHLDEIRSVPFEYLLRATSLPEGNDAPDDE